LPCLVRPYSFPLFFQNKEEHMVLGSCFAILSPQW
jgi:hypothetical protein